MRKIILFLIVFCFLFSSLCFSGCVDNRPIDEYFIEIRYTDGRLEGDLTYTFLLKDENKEVYFNLYPNAYFEDGQGIEIKNLQFKQSDCNWETVGKNNEFLKVCLPDACKKNSVYTLRMRFETAVPQSFSRHGNAGEVINLAYFYPVACVYEEGYLLREFSAFGDPFVSDFANYSVKITVPSVMSVACGGSIKGVQISGSESTYLYSLNNAKTFACSFSENYSVVKRKTKEVNLSYFYYSDKEPEKKLDLIEKTLDYLQMSIGDCLYENLAVAQSPYFAGGMEYPAFCVVGENTNLENYEYAIVHEICHQIAPVVLSTDEWISSYLDEGLAEFLTYSFMQKEKGDLPYAHALYCETFLNAYKNFCNERGESYNGVMNRGLESYQSKEDYVATAYYKGFLFFYFLNENCEEVLPVIKKLYEKKPFKRISEENIINVMKNKKKARELFNKFVFNGEDILLEK